MLEPDGPLVDRTATGATPPRVLAPARCSPPGLPEEFEQTSQEEPSLLTALGVSYSREIFRAARVGDVVILEKMIQDAHAKTDETRYQAEEVTRLLSVARDISGETLVGAAAKHGEASAVQLLLSHRADPTAADSRGRMALHRAAEGGDLLSTLLVLDRLQLANRYVNVTDFVDNAGESPGTLAAQSGCEEVCPRPITSAALAAESQLQAVRLLDDGRHFAVAEAEAVHFWSYAGRRGTFQQVLRVDLPKPLRSFEVEGRLAYLLPKEGKLQVVNFQGERVQVAQTPMQPRCFDVKGNTVCIGSEDGSLMLSRNPCPDHWKRWPCPAQLCYDGLPPKVIWVTLGANEDRESPAGFWKDDVHCFMMLYAKPNCRGGPLCC
eukprot:g7369.t1